MTDLFGVTLPEMIRELELELDERRTDYVTLDRKGVISQIGPAHRRIEILHAIIARLKRGAAEAA